MFGHKTGLNKFKNIEIISSIFYHHNAFKLEINCKNKVGKPTNMWSLNNVLFDNDWVNEEIKNQKKHRDK